MYMLQLKVEINIRSGYLVDRKKLRQALMNELQQWIEEGSYLVSILIAGNRLMKQLEKKYFQKDKTTDVLSFPLLESKNPKVAFPFLPDQPQNLGEIIISYPQAQLQAAQKHVLIDEEICHLAQHGLRHLLGINHN